MAGRSRHFSITALVLLGTSVWQAKAIPWLGDGLFGGILGKTPLAECLNKTQATRIVSPVPAQNESFGFAASLNGNTLVVGAPGAINETGAVYVFRREFFGDWILHDTLMPENSAPGGRFGAAVVAKSGQIVIGAPGNGSIPGQVFIFREGLFGGFSMVVALSSNVSSNDSSTQDGASAGNTTTNSTEGGNTTAVGGGFGSNLDMSLLGHIVVADPSQQSVLVYAPSLTGEYNEPQTLPLQLGSQDGNSSGNAIAPLQNIPVKISLFGDFVAVGRPEEDSIFIFQNIDQEWTMLTSLAPANATGGAFGTSLDGTLNFAFILVGAPDADNGGNAYAYRKHDNQWQLEALLTSQIESAGSNQTTGSGGNETTGGAGGTGNETIGSVDNNGNETSGAGGNQTSEADLFGASVAFGGIVPNYVIIGAPGANDNLGAACFYKREDIQWTFETCVAPEQGLQDEEFGSAVDADNAVAVVSAPKADDGAGAIYLYAC